MQSKTTAILKISIHSLRVEGDYSIITYLAQYVKFQSTPSVWRETARPRHSRRDYI